MLQFGGKHQPFVDDSAAAETGNVEALYTGGAGTVHDRLSGKVKDALKFVACFGGLRRAADNHLLHPRARGISTSPQCLFNHRHRTEGEHLDMHFVEHLADNLAGTRAVVGILAKEVKLPDGQIGRGRGFDFETIQFALEEFVRELREETCAVASLAVVGNGAAVGMVAQGFQRHLDDAMAAPSFHLRHKANATGIVFMTGVVHAARTRKIELGRYDRVDSHSASARNWPIRVISIGRGERTLVVVIGTARQ